MTDVNKPEPTKPCPECGTIFPKSKLFVWNRNDCWHGEAGDPMFTLQATKQHGVGVRRLTPTECERLQGFPDGWTCLCQPLETYDSNACKCPDGPRYKTLGNAVTVPVIRWIGTNLMRLA